MNEPEHVNVRIEFAWRPVGPIKFVRTGYHSYPRDPALRFPGTYRLHAGGWPMQADELPECWYIGMSSTNMLQRIRSHLREPGLPHCEGPKPFRWILENGGWVTVWIVESLRINGVTEENIDRALVARGVEAGAIISNLSYMGRRNIQL
jgi:hypothetical protein